MTLTLVLGGARSGKSGYAEHRAADTGREVLYVATARACDGEMAGRIARHRAQRPAHWATVEEPVHLGDALATHASPSRVILIDCLTLWLSNVLFAGSEPFPEVGEIELPHSFVAERAALLSALASAKGDIILVSNEVGMGIVPMGAATRMFMDEAGRLNQALAAVCGEVVFVAAGLPLVLKASSCSPV
ncbi:bifunctional adenosylcobinamide kinase/adenosylcobinamide-phosphate guanylyltransferase [Massilia sp. PAMC28688]|uniref:bifunctional adenosylcobinamide kinase/adenosylcobinamide-phosphate guanylyltransferase n=1 Tax=Massilia sp. PAMC28688 TaxID=2861283 RepID=UPI001C628634|nr:bifunctional adenosylcobinamide kinase/adenosylcobinamide-phosphate guanylyltransferase [Massilia sp. PAMC28688]QYF94596.1 bifunctional adenosylcobinamide kinase/adenosylcobinamide-phosphate guanylyltransferase [Massilia sp. PAMC28688]